MHEIIIQSDGTFLIPRGHAADNQFFSELFREMATEDIRVSLENFFATTEDSELIFGSPGLCG